MNRQAWCKSITVLAEIPAPDVQRFLDHVRTTRTHSKKSISNMWVALSSFLTCASVELNAEHIIRNRVRQPEYQAPVIQIYTEVDRPLYRDISAQSGWHRQFQYDQFGGRTTLSSEIANQPKESNPSTKRHSAA